MEKIDLATLDIGKVADEGRELDIRHPKTGEPVGIRLRLYGTDSAAYQRTSRAQQRLNMDRLTRSRRVRFTPEEMDENALELLVAVTAGWSPFDLDGAEYAYNAANAAALYRRFAWLRDQADEFIGDRANFLPRPATP